ncbi:hypothetical protein [Kitasatospora sp. DSM 101779]|uniref:hypothetical protein n=1 Tax=Kitasatospora sp. DSM 101779 TaxID=2853165 RepID=UPI0021D9A458|nr:hypothetical protein [Kitasatospora sp. DSM 101779]MCU7821998.1 hypothetical protein [Kitasatospora sp. DSM 101779]
MQPRTRAALALAAALLLAGCTPGVQHTAAPAPSGGGPTHHNRIHTGSEASPSYWVRSPTDRFALLVEETGSRSDPGGTRRRALIRSYAPSSSATGEGTLGAVVWRDTTAYGTFADSPAFRWEDAGDRVWIVLTPGGVPYPSVAFRVAAEGAGGAWSARTVSATEYGDVPESVLRSVPQPMRGELGLP